MDEFRKLRREARTKLVEFIEETVDEKLTELSNERARIEAIIRGDNHVINN